MSYISWRNPYNYRQKRWVWLGLSELQRLSERTFYRNLSCVFLYDHIAWLCPSKSSALVHHWPTRGRNQLRIPDLSSDKQDQTEKLNPLICTDLAQMSIIVARKRLGHFTASSQEEQIASALHDCSGDGPERGLCSPRGKPECPGSAAEAGMWAFWKWAGAACCTYYFGPIFPTSTQSWNSGSQDLRLHSVLGF